MFGDLFKLIFIVSLQIFEGNSKERPQKKNILRPPVVTSAIRVVPEIFPDKQVCLRLELLGCSLKNGNFYFVFCKLWPSSLCANQFIECIIGHQKNTSHTRISTPTG